MEHFFNLAILECLRLKGFAKFQQSGFNLLRGAVRQNLESVFVQLKQLAEINQREDVSVIDLLQYLEANDYNIEELTAFAREHDYAEEQSQKVISRFIKEFTGEDASLAKVGEAEVQRISEVGSTTLAGATPIGFARVSRDIEKRFFILGPDRVELSEKPAFEPTKVSTTEFKDSRIEEKRVYELEMGKLKGFEGEKKYVESEQGVKSRADEPHTNALELEADFVEALKETEISINQMF